MTSLRTADAVIIGGGVIGTSLLYHLTRLGMTDVVLLEKGELASGSSGDSAAIVRQHYSNEVSIRLVKKSLQVFQSFANELGDAGAFTPSGWLFLCPPEASRHFEDNMAQLKGLGVNTWEITLDEASEKLPGLNPDGIGRVAFEPDSGYAAAHRVARAFAARASDAGADVRTNTAATGIRVAVGRVEAVETEDGEIATPIVVNAAGPWAKRVGQWAGLELPLEISREQDVIVRPPAGTPTPALAVSNRVDRTYLRPEADGSLLVGTGHPKENEPADPDGFRRDADASFIDDVTRRLVHRFPAMAGSELMASWAGLYTVTPDWSMIVDRAPGIDGMYLAVGGSGHSFKLAPAIGLCLAELIVNGAATTVDITPLRALRFEEADGLRSTYGGNRG